MIKHRFNRVERIFIGKKEVDKIMLEDQVAFVKPTDELTYTILPSGLAVDGIIDETIEYISIPSKIKGTNDVPTLIKEGAFRTLPIKSVVIPNVITKILGGDTFDKGAFQGCNELSFVHLGKNVQEIGGYAFGGCTSLKTIHLPYYLRGIGWYAFIGCTGLTSVTFENNNILTSIGGHAFRECSALTSIIIPNSVTSIGNYVFYKCSALKSITIPSGVTSIGYAAFQSCSSLTDVYFKGTKAQWDKISIDSYNTALTNATIHFNS